MALACARCRGAVDVASRHVAVAGTSVLVYCSEACLQGITELIDDGELISVVAPPRRRRMWIAAGIVIGGTFAVAETVERDAPIPVVPVISLAEPAPVPKPPPAAVIPAVTAPPPEDEALLRELMQDAWIHPLAGPHRRMPINHTAAFGAERQVEPRPECVSGHCGVDVGGAVWGEQVHAVHDGVVDWVNRGPNEEHGGVFVKLAHRGGSLYSWYFHLAAVPRWIKPGVRIAVGQVIGLLGDTGVQRSGPHLHFAMTVKPPGGARERYIDPEPLIAIWPLWIEEDGKGHMSTAAPPGVPVREPGRAKPVAAASPEAPSGAAAQNDNQAITPATAPAATDSAPKAAGLSPASQAPTSQAPALQTPASQTPASQTPASPDDRAR
jgi:hypothetical protein